ncbi:MAG: hypothetical protein HZA21_02205 [Nitrospirae bacterium]|nr:hypothetical protein [Nitrospirota bacterium]
MNIRDISQPTCTCARWLSATMVLALLLCMPDQPLSAKDWDMDRGKYLPDLEIYLLSEPVQTVTTEYRKPDGAVSQLVRWEFDRSGNLLESRTITFSSSCSKQVYTYDASGHRLTLQSFSTQQQPLPLVGKDDCKFPAATEYSTFSYELDGRGQMTSRSKTYYGQSSPAVREEFRYDFPGNLVEHQWLVGPRKDRQYRNRYAYDTFPGGRRVFRQANYDEDQSAVDVRIVTTYDTKGKLRTYTKTPPGASGFYNDYDNIYDGNGNLKSSGSGESRTDYSGHDARGNWTKSASYQGGSLSQTAVRTIQYFK